ncbi:MAG: hypothetical protein ACIPMY_06215 [Rickettsia endosymbiont of Pentastiridius leporinus]
MKDYSKEALVQYLIQNISEYKEYWKKEIEGWEKSERTFHLEMISLLHFTKNQIEQNETKHLRFIFNLIENLLDCGNEDADNAAWTIFLEGLPYLPDKYCTLSFDAYNKYLGPKSLKALEIINAPPDPEIVLRWEKAKQYKASIPAFLLESLNNKIKDYNKFREEDIKKWKEEGQTRPLPVEMTTLLEFIKIKLANKDHETITKILDSVKETAEYAKDEPYFHQLLEHWYKILKSQ